MTKAAALIVGAGDATGGAIARAFAADARQEDEMFFGKERLPQVAEALAQRG